VRPVFLWVLRRTDSIQNGPSQGITTLTLLLVLASSWFTGKSATSIQSVPSFNTCHSCHWCSRHFRSLSHRSYMSSRRWFRHQID
jgi:hypothetical protein